MASAELQAVIEQLRANPIDPSATVDVLRASFPEAPALEGTTVTPIDVGGVAAEWVVADNAASDQRLLYLHGGGYVICGPATHRDLAGRLSKAAGVSLLVLDYRLAPEHPYPAAVDDALAALRWMKDNGPDGASPASATFVAGDSAGGGLTLATLIAARDTGMPMPNAAVVISGWTDLACTGETILLGPTLTPW